MFGNDLANVGLVTFPEERFACSCLCLRVCNCAVRQCYLLCAAPRCYVLLSVCCCAPLCSAASFCVLLCAAIVVDPVPQLSDPAAPRQWRRPVHSHKTQITMHVHMTDRHTHMAHTRSPNSVQYLYDHPPGDEEVGEPPGHRRDTRRDTGGQAQNTGQENICLDFAPATEGSFLSPAPTQLRLASPHARTKRNDFPVGRLRSTSISPPNLLQHVFHSCATSDRASNIVS